jgi:hypothetical protein
MYFFTGEAGKKMTRLDSRRARRELCEAFWRVASSVQGECGSAQGFQKRENGDSLGRKRKWFAWKIQSFPEKPAEFDGETKHPSQWAQLCANRGLTGA